MKRNLNYYTAAMLTALTMCAPVGGNDTTLHNGFKRKSNPWDSINLAKADRKGKTFEETQAMRKTKWVAQQKVQADSAEPHSLT